MIKIMSTQSYPKFPLSRFFHPEYLYAKTLTPIVAINKAAVFINLVLLY